MKKFLSLFALLLCALALVACNDNGVEGAGEAFKVLSLEDLKNGSSEENPIVVEFWHSFGHNITKNLDPLIEAFEEEYKAKGIYIDVQAKSTGGGYDGLRSRVNMGIKSNSIPTMILGYPDHFASYIDNEILLTLDDYVDAKDAEIALENKEDFVDNYWDECLMDVDGKESVVAIPFNKSTEVMYYNASAVDPILKELGIVDYVKDESGNPVTDDNGNTLYENWTNPTWEQVWEVSEILKERADAGTLTWTNPTNGATVKAEKGKYPTYIDSAANFFITVTRQWGGTYTRQVEGTKGEVAFYNDKAIEAQQYFIAKANEGLWNLPNKVNQSYGSYELNQNKAFISIGSTAGVNNNDSDKYELKVAAYPQKSYDNTSIQAVIQQGTNAAILSANSNNKTRLAAWLLIKYLSNSENTAKFSMGTGYLPVRESALTSDKYVAFKNDVNNPYKGNVAKTVNAAEEQKEYTYVDFAFSGSSIVRDKVDVMIVSIYCNDRPITTAMETAYSELQKLRVQVVKEAK